MANRLLVCRVTPSVESKNRVKQVLQHNEKQANGVTHRRHSKVSECFNISDTAKKLCESKSNGGIAVVKTNKLPLNRDSKPKPFWQKSGNNCHSSHK